MKTIIRIQHETGNGLWRTMIEGDFLCTSLSFHDELSEKHEDFPTPAQENHFLKKEEFCAFKSIEQLQEWIKPNWFKEIMDLGFRILMIEVSEAITLTYQVMYEKQNITKISDISKLF